jgi:hypothetical protein
VPNTTSGDDLRDLWGTERDPFDCFDKTFLLCGEGKREAALCVNGIHNKQTQIFPVEMLYQELNFKK